MQSGRCLSICLEKVTQAQYFQSSSPYSGNYNASEMDYTVMGPDASNNYKIKYDLNGNILAMVQRGWKPGSPTGQVDGLRYTYYDYTNKLKQVTDDNNDYNSKLGDFKYDPATKSPTADYGYDINGNLITDQNKKIGASTGVNLTSGGGITYNYLNLPVTVSLSGGRTISYTYDNSGDKLQKTTYEPSGTVIFNGTPTSTSISTTTLYIGPFVYESKYYGNSTVNTAMGCSMKPPYT
jgi:YD repeat-containing protein